ncbi:Rrf2 family transcriptional regulator [Shewanella sp.]|uniref:Rrf2 family transcriptional regulator n=1 Tax=Shewanella sp. TaxID=50422 RepID=UPI004053CC79
MQLTRYTNYGIRILMYLAIQPERVELFRIAEITQVFELSANHVAKIVHHLGKLGYLKTIRGKNGGFRLARFATEINLGSIVRELEHSLVQVNCGEPYCRFTPVCNLKSILAKALEAYLAVLDSYYLSDIINNKDKLLGSLADPTISVLNLS